MTLVTGTDFSSLPVTGWSTEPSGYPPAQFVELSPGVELVVTPTSSGPNPSSELASVFYTGTRGGSGVVGGVDYGHLWYGVKARFRSGVYFPTPGEWSWVVEWHTGDPVQLAGGNSCGLHVVTDLPSGANPRLVWRCAGGVPSSPTYLNVNAGPLAYDHDYELVGI